MGKKTLLTFVHLGSNPSPCLLSMANIAQHHNSSIDLVLVTDKPELHAQFPGRLVDYKRSEINPWMKKFISKRREITDIAGGYWLHTLERIFALRAVIPYVNNQVFIHIESDVYFSMSEKAVEVAATKLSSLAVPRFSETRGIASIMISPSKQKLIEGLDNLQKILEGNPRIDNDMLLLGTALNSGILEELPTNPRKNMVLSDSKVVFDGAALGQYLFGQDPFHTNGQRISGFVNQETDFDASEFTYSIRTSQNSGIETAYIDDVEILNLHIHSKLELPPISASQGIWKTAIAEANGLIARTPDAFRADVIHTKKISFINRIRIASRRGLIMSLLNYAKKKIVYWIKMK